MKTELPLLDVRTRMRWRAWLHRHHASSPGIWLIYHKAHTGIACLSLDESIAEALCYGWIDSLIKRVDDARYARKFTPRRVQSSWSATNRSMWRELKAAGLLAPARLAQAPNARTSVPPRVVIPEMPAYLAKALRAKPTVWQAFQSLAPSHRREYVTWVHMAVKEETRRRRIAKVIELLAARKKLGLR